MRSYSSLAALLVILWLLFAAVPSGNTVTYAAAATNLACAGSIAAYTTEYAPGWEAVKLIDFNYSTGWGSNAPVTLGQWVQIVLLGTQPSLIRLIRIHPGPVGGDPPAAPPDR